MARFKNIVGTAFEDYVQEQITTRQQVVNKQVRTPSDIQWLSNRTGWFRLSSGVNVEEDDGYSAKQAQLNVLQGGSVAAGGDKTALREGFEETYTKGTDDNLGYKPMPGIVGARVGTGGKWQTLLQADINFVCYNLDQLDLMTKLYMSLGMTVFFEWGHTPYVDNQNKLNTNVRPINFFKYTDKDELLQAITKKRKETNGNYDAMVGTVYNFDWSANNDGSYNCKVKIMGPGGILESLKINGSVSIDFDKNDNDISSKKYNSTLGNALYSMKQYLESREDLFRTAVSQDENGKNQFSFFRKVDPSRFFQVTKYEVSTGKSSLFVKDIKEKIDGSWGGILNEIYSSATYNKINFIPIDDTGAAVTYINDDTTNILANPSMFGNAHQLLKGIDVPSNDDLDPITTDFYSGYVSKLQIDDGSKLISSYITFGHLMALIQHIAVFNETNESINISSSSPDTSTCKPIVYLDYHPDNTIISKSPLECSIDPTKCVIPFSLDRSKGQTLNDIFDPLDTESKGAYSFWRGIDKPNNHSKNLLLNPQKNKVNQFAPEFEGKLFNVLINLEFAYSTLKSLADSKTQEVNLLEYLDKILDGINLSLGKTNNLRPFVGDDGKILRIVDEEPVEPITSENLLTIPNFGLNSIAYDYSFSSKITPLLARQIVIAAQARDTDGTKQFSEDVLSYQSMNVDIEDRFSKVKLPAIVKKTTDADEKTGKTLKTQQKLFDHIYYCYSGDEKTNIGLKSDGINDLVNPFGDLMGIKKKTAKKVGTPLIPLEFNLTLDGISGILPYNAFLIPNNRLPKKYRGRVAFIIFSINHNLDNNKWITTLRGQIINLDTPEFETTTTTITGTGDPVEPPTPTSIDTDFPEVERTPPTVNIGTTEVPDNSFTPNELPDAPVGQPVQLTPVPTAPAVVPNADITAAVNFIKPREGFRSEPYPDPDWNSPRIGYGSDTITNPDGSFYKITRKSRVDKTSAERDLVRRITDEFKPRVLTRLNSRSVAYDSLPLKLQVVFIDLAYNYGTLFYSFIEAYKENGVQGVINELQRRADLGGTQVPSRRLAEIKYLQG